MREQRTHVEYDQGQWLFAKQLEVRDYYARVQCASMVCEYGAPHAETQLWCQIMPRLIPRFLLESIPFHPLGCLSRPPRMCQCLPSRQIG